MTPLPIHPRTGLTALGLRRDGRPIWPVLGGDGTGGDPPPPPPAADPPTGPPAGDPAKPSDEPLGPAGLKALHEEREARKALEKELAGLAPLKKIAAALGGDGTGGTDGKTDYDRLSERLASHETDLATERSARWRAEVAHEKGLTPAQAARLQGASRDEMAADADALLALFPAGGGQGGGGRAPAPDPSQGARGNPAGADLEAQIAEAQKAGDWRTALRLQNQKLHKKK